MENKVKKPSKLIDKLWIFSLVSVVIFAMASAMGIALMGHYFGWWVITSEKIYGLPFFMVCLVALLGSILPLVEGAVYLRNHNGIKAKKVLGIVLIAVMSTLLLIYIVCILLAFKGLGSEDDLHIPSCVIVLNLLIFASLIVLFVFQIRNKRKNVKPN